MAAALAVTTAARTARAEAGIKARQPLSELVVNLHNTKSVIPDELIEVIKKEINVKEVLFVSTDEAFVDYKVQPLLKELAPKVRGEINAIKLFLESLSRDEAKETVQSIKNTGKVNLTINDVEWVFTSSEILVHALPTEGYIMGDSKGVEVFLKTAITEELQLEGLARGIVRHIQENRKNLKLDYLDRIHVSLSSQSEIIKSAIQKYRNYIKEETQADTLKIIKRNNAITQTIDGNEVALLVEPVQI